MRAKDKQPAANSAQDASQGASPSARSATPREGQAYSALPWSLGLAPWLLALLYTLVHIAAYWHGHFHADLVRAAEVSPSAVAVTAVGELENFVHTSVVLGWSAGIAMIFFGTLIMRKEYRERQRFLNTLTRSEEKYRHLFELAPIAYLTLDSSGRILSLNEAGSLLLGFKPHDIVARKLGELLYAEDRSEDPVDLLKTGPAASPLELVFRHQGGRPINVSLHSRIETDANGNCLRIHCTLMDVTEQKHQRKALVESEARFRLIAENTGDIVWLYDLESLQIEYISPSVFSSLGYHSEQMLGRNVFDFLTPESAELGRQALGERLEAINAGEWGKASRMYELDLRSAWGTTINAEILSTIISDEGGRPSKVIGVSRDVSKRKDQEKALGALLQSTSSSMGKEFASILVRELAKVLGVDFVFLGTLVPGENGERIRTTAIWAKGRLVDNFDYPIKGAPCAKLLHGSMYHAADGVCDLFPQALIFKQMGISGYLGAPLLTRSGTVIGVLVAMHTRTIPPNSTFSSLLTLLAMRASLEMERTRTIEALEESEKRFRHTVEQSQAGYFRIGANRCFEDVNQAWLDIHGFGSRSEVIGKPYCLTQNEEELPAANAIIERVFSGYSQPPGEFSHKTKNGSIGHHTFTISPVLKSGIVCAIEGFIIDSSALRQAKADYATLFNEMVGGLAVQEVVLDSEGKVCDLRFLAVNPSFEKMLGLHSSDLIGHRSKEIFPDLDPFWIETLGKVATSGESTSFEHEVINSDHLFSITAFQSSSGCVAITFSDITASRRAQAELERDEAQIRRQAALLDVTRDAICVLGVDFAVEYWNRGAENIFGWTAQEVFGCDWEILIFKEESEEFRAAWNIIMQKGEWTGELKALSKEGEPRVLQCQGTRLGDSYTGSLSALLVCSDITKAKAMEATLLHMQRIDSLGSIASGIAHDLNNILSPILMTVDLLPAKMQHPEDRAIVDMLRTSAHRCAEIVQQLLVFSRNSNASRQAIDPGHAVMELAGIVRQTFPKRIELECDIAPNLWHVHADSTQLYQVLLNLCVNARDSIEHEGRIRIRVENVQVDEAFLRKYPEAKPGPLVCIAINDTGVGIPPEAIGRIFEPFFTTKPEGKGTGLGLPTALGIVKNHGGFIGVKSKLGEGSEISVYLPALPDYSETTPIDKTNEDFRGNGELILVIDDEETIQHLINISLEQSNYRVLHAADGVQALALFNERKDEVKLAITDMVMPHLDGQRTIKDLRRINSSLPIIAMSGMLEQKAIIDALGEPGVHFLSKPFTVKKMLAVIHELILPSAGA
jgi:PAS domain S-box-containing protein